MGIRKSRGIQSQDRENRDSKNVLVEEHAKDGDGYLEALDQNR